MEQQARATVILLRCSFCGKSQDEVSHLVAGPSAYICSECVDLCNEIIGNVYTIEVDGEETELIFDSYHTKQDLLSSLLLYDYDAPLSKEAANKIVDDTTQLMRDDDVSKHLIKALGIRTIEHLHAAIRANGIDPDSARWRGGLSNLFAEDEHEHPPASTDTPTKKPSKKGGKK